MVAAVITAIAVSGVGRSGSPAGSESTWLQRSTPALDHLAADSAVPSGTAWTPRQIDRLRADLAVLRSIGHPPAAAPSRAWAELLADVSTAISDAVHAPAQARAALGGAELELTELTELIGR